MVIVSPPAGEPVLGETVVMAGAGVVEMFMDKLLEAVAALESLTWAPNAKEPATLGVPEIAPVDELSDSPVGSCPLTVLQV
jgi:hypothetical protein